MRRSKTMDTKNSQNGYTWRPWAIDRAIIDRKDYTAAAEEVSSASPTTADFDLWRTQIYREDKGYNEQPWKIQKVHTWTRCRRIPLRRYQNHGYRELTE